MPTRGYWKHRPVHFANASSCINNRIVKSHLSNERISLPANGHIELFLLITLIVIAPLWNSRAQLTLSSTNAGSKHELTLQAVPENIWEEGVGEGFRSTTRDIGLSAGASYGIAAFGSIESHDLGLVSLSYGHMLGHTSGQGHWYRGNLEFRLELITAAQFSPHREWLVGLTSHLRYNFATGTRWIPFFDAGIGVTATSIGHPDLSGYFEFNLQVGPGIQWFLKDKVAITLEARYLHLSSAGISKPNLGVNCVAGMLGLAFYF